MKIIIIDYGIGNIKSIINSLRYLKIDNIIVSNKKEDITLSDKIILPGVGSFGNAIKSIQKFKIDEHLQEAVLINKKPILGICLGMQLMNTSSEEDGFHNGLNFISGNIEKFKTQNLKIPHVGFNQINFNSNSRLYKDLDNFSDFYFTHSFKMRSDKNINQSFCNYEDDFIASYELDNIAGVQFHPELSQTNGLKLLDNFLKNF